MDVKSWNCLENIETLELPNTLDGFSFTYMGHRFFYDGTICLAKTGELHPELMMWAKVGKARWPKGKVPTEQEEREALLYHVEIAVETIMMNRDKWASDAMAGHHVMPCTDDDGEVYGIQLGS